MKKVLILGLLALGMNAVLAETQEDNFLNLNGTFYAPGTMVSEEKTENGRRITVQQPLDVNLPEFVLNKVENRVFNRTFTGDYKLSRLQRLEKEVYGAIQTGNAQSRLQRLIVATKNYTKNPYSYMQNYNQASDVYNPYNPYSQYRPFKQSGIKNFLNTLSGGTLTGWSPPVTGYNTQSGYNSPYSGSPYSGFQNPSPTNTMNLFSNGAGGREMYWDDGQYRKNLNSTDGGLGVKVIY